MKKSILLMMMIGVIFLGTACGAGAKYADYGMKTLMEASTADWVKTIEKDCKITGFGRPYGTVTVSYTHLDVYKRQAVISLLFAGHLIGIGLGTILTVIGVGRVIALFNRLLESKVTGMAQVNKIE